MQKKILLIGDLNEDCLQTKPKPIETEIEKLGLTNIFKHSPTTSSQTSLDCIYSNFLQSEKKVGQIIETLYSFHEMLFIPSQRRYRCFEDQTLHSPRTG